MALNIRSPLFGEHHTLWNAESQHWDFGSSDTDSYANVAYENVIESLQDIKSNNKGFVEWANKQL